MSTVTCANCNSKNIEGSKFCNHCGAALPLSTHISCPTCQTRNPRNLMYCDNCGTRLLPTGELSSEREEEKPQKPKGREAPKAFSLPARDPGEELDANRLLDWLRTGEENPESEGNQIEPEALPESEDSGENVLGNWLDELSDVKEGMTADPPEEGGINDWLSELETLDGGEGDTTIEDTLPNWLDDLNFEDSGESPEVDSSEETLADWFSDFETEADGETESSDLADTDILGPDLVRRSPRVPTAEDFEKTLRAPSPFHDDDEETVQDWLSEFDDTAETRAEAEETDLADWLSDVDESSDTPTLIESFESTTEEDELPDWLTDFESGEDEGEMPTLISPASSIEEDELPDWFSEVESDEDEGEMPTLISPASSIEEDELPDWFSEGESDEDGTPTLIGPAVSFEDEDEEVPDWLSDFETEEESPTLIAPAPSSDAPEEEETILPDWLGEVEAGEASAMAEPDGDEAEEVPDWLEDFGDDEKGLVESAVSSEDVDEELPDWLGDSEVDYEEALGETAVSFEDEDEELPDWLGDFEDEDEKPLVEAAVDETAAEEEVFEDWLADLESEEDTPTLVAATSSVDENDEIPDWLSDFEDESEVEELVPAEEEVGEDSLPADWFEDFSDEDDTLFTLEEIEGEEGSGELPDWLSEMASEETGSADLDDETEDIIATLNTAEFVPVDELPDWMAEMTPETNEATDESQTIGDLEAEDEEMPDWLSDASDDGEPFDFDEDTDWLEALNQEDPWPEGVDDEELAAQLGPAEYERDTQDPLRPSEELSGVPKELVSSSLPDWLQEDMPQISSLDEEEPLTQGELPEWLQQMRPSELSGEEGLGLEEGLAAGETQDEWQTIFANMPSGERGLGLDDSEISAAEIPAWLQALRPTTGDEEPEMVLADENPETEGPLAGLRGVLQIAPLVTKPAASTTMPRYTISKEQQQQIALLHRLTHEEPAATKQVAMRRSAALSASGRALLGILLFLVILAGVLLPRTDIPLPETALPVSQDALDAFNAIDPLVGVPVLVAFDYTPAMAAELDPIAEMLLRQLATNGNRVLTISQTAAGTTIADRVANEVNGLESQSLGLLTGEAVGLRSLGSCLNGAETCGTLFGSSIDPAVQNDLTNLGLVIVLTSDRNSLINWIEQVESETDAPVVTAVTQPLGPLTLPYLSSNQLEGSLNGIPSASAYEKRLLGQDGGTFQQFTAQSIGMWVVILALAAAAIFYGLAGLARRDEKKGNG